tara:strand:+ start:131 stop:1321 length:1191 start_codon:yes stop_codon:yes gene_type:complete
MARDIPTTFTPQPIIHFAPKRPIHDGTSASVAGEVDLANNINHLWAYHTPQVVNQICNHNIGTSADAPGWYLLQAQQNSGDVLLGFYLPLIHKWSANEPAVLKVYCYAKMDTGSNTGTITAKLHNENATGTATVAAHNVENDFAWYRIELEHDNDALTEDILLISLTAGSGGEEVLLHSVSAYWVPYSDSTVQDGGAQHDGFLPFDSQEFDQDSPLSTELRTRMFDNLERIRKNRSDVIWAFSDTPIKRFNGAIPFEIGGGSFSVQGIIVARIKFRSKPGQTKIRWAALLQKSGADTGLKLRVQTTHQVIENNGSFECGSVVPHGGFTLLSSWDYAGADNSFIDGWVTHATYEELDCFEDSIGEIIVTIHGDNTTEADGGVTATLKGFTAWFKEVS